MLGDILDHIAALGYQASPCNATIHVPVMQCTNLSRRKFHKKKCKDIPGGFSLGKFNSLLTEIFDPDQELSMIFRLNCIQLDTKRNYKSGKLR